MYPNGGNGKKPIELTVGILRTLEILLRDSSPVLARSNKQLGQNLFDPPNAKGWPGEHDMDHPTQLNDAP